MIHSFTRKHDTAQDGFTLVELLVGMVIGLFLMAVLVQLFISNKQAYRLQENLARAQENGRFALEFISRDLRQADFWGCAQPGAVQNLLDTDGDATDNGWDETGSGFDLMEAGNLLGIKGPPGGYHVAAAAANVAGLPNADAVTIVGATGTPAQVAATMPGVASPVTIAANPQGIAPTNRVIVSDCQGGDLFMVTNDTDGNPLTLEHASTAGNDNSSGSLQRTYDATAQVYPVQSVTYSVDVSNGVPVLRRSDRSNANQPVVEGVEKIRVLFGEDTTGDGTANRYVSINNVTDLTAVVSARIWVMVRTDEEINDAPVPVTFAGTTITPTDRRSRRVFTSTISLRNRLL